MLGGIDISCVDVGWNLYVGRCLIDLTLHGSAFGAIDILWVGVWWNDVSLVRAS